jgi:serine/arginine repetitive matrix protein 2
LASRPPSSRSIGPAAATPSRSRIDWFSRSSSGTSSISSPNRNPSTSDLSGHQRTSPTRREEESAAKLIKRKSLGFLPLRRNRGGPVNEGSEPALVQGQSDLPSDLEAELENATPAKRHYSQQYSRPPIQAGPSKSRHASYSSHRVAGSSDKVSEPRSRRASPSRSRSRGPAEEVSEGDRGFMGSMRRMSLVSKHKRTKSTVSSLAEDQPPLPTEGNGKDREQELRDAAYEDLVGYKTPPRKSSRLPPIELQPPSPPQSKPPDPSLDQEMQELESERERSLLSQSVSGGATSPPRRPLSPSQKPVSPQSASVGRSGVVASQSAPATNVLRRNSLGDLKIPTRISQAQISLRRDLGLVREFATHVERKSCYLLQIIYKMLMIYFRIEGTSK